MISHVSAAVGPGRTRCREDGAIAGALLGLLIASGTTASAAPPDATGKPLPIKVETTWDLQDVE